MQAVAVLDSATREMFWYGKEAFEEKRNIFEKWIDELQLTDYMNRPLPTWEQLIREFKRNSELRERARGTISPAPSSDEHEAQPSTEVDIPLLCTIVSNYQEHASKEACQSRVGELDSQPCAPSVWVQQDTSNICLQSDEAETVMDVSEPSSVISTTVVEFLDETPGTSWAVPRHVCTNLTDQQPMTELAHYLSRPVLIDTFVWSQSLSGVQTNFSPWYLFFNSTPIKNKISNYGYINCTLKVKFVINASPFYSGAMAFTYCPMVGFVGENIIQDAIAGEMIEFSQRPKVWVYPQTCEGGELELPFFYHQNWLDLRSASDCTNMGGIRPVVYGQLVSANGVTTTSVVIQIYAWAENVKLHAPTTGTILQSSEFDYKPSQIASGVAKAAGSLSRIPLIGPYMKATSSVASGFASVAAALGFTNVPNMDPVDAVKLQPFPHNASCEVSVPVDRSAVDPKNEVCLDPRTVGLDGTDELSIAYIAGREAWIGNAILSSTDSVDTLTLVSRVSPMLCAQYTANTPIHFTPMCYVGNMFAAWRGDIIFRFKFVCTRFHKGRVRITFDPRANISTTTPDYTTVFNEVVDIGAEQDIEVRVPYAQGVTFLRTNLSTSNYNLQGTTLAPDAYSNGLITMRVVNPLSGPLANTAIPVMVFVRAAENIEFAHPTSQPATQTFSPLALQSGEVEYPVAPMQVIVGNKATMGDPNKYLVHFGEAVASFRPLLHRMSWQYSLITPSASTTNTALIFNFAQSRRLKYGGFDANGPWTAQQIIGTGTGTYNFIKNNIPQLVSLLYIGQRGSITHSYNVESQSFNTQTMALKRHDATISASSYNSYFNSTATSTNQLSQFYQIVTEEPNSGVSLTDARNQPAIAMNFPYYSRYNFQFVQPLYANVGTSTDGTDIDNVILQVAIGKVNTAGPLKVDAWAQLGPDYNFFFFRNTPSLYSYTVPRGV
jgi:hypothetical protein